MSSRGAGKSLGKRASSPRRGQDAFFPGGKGRSLALAEELLAAGDAPLNDRDLGQIKNLILDHLGCCYAGSLLTWGRRLHEWAAPHAGSGNAAVLLRLSARELARGWGLALSMAGGSMQFSQEPEGTTVKRLHGGYAALHGVMAAEHAALGIAGPEQALEGRYGLIHNFGSKSDIERLNRPHPNGPEIHRISYKPYPCCRLFHSTLDALAEVTDDFSLDPEEIESLVVGGPDIMVTQHMLRRPTSEMAAQYSLPFTLGAALYYGPSSVAGFMGDALNDSRTLAIADRVEAVADPDMQAVFPAHFGSWLELTARNGRRRRSDVLDSLGTPANPMQRHDLMAKFAGLTAVNKAINAAEVAATLDNLRQLQRIDPLLSSFCS